jgi:heat shock protein HtpX
MDFHRTLNNAKILGLLSVLTGAFLSIGYLVGGTSGMIIGLFFAGIMNFGSYWFSDRIVLKIYGAEKVERSDRPDLYDAVERLAEDAGIPVPELYISKMDVPNAFATGRNPEHGVVCVTQGLLRNLEQEEVEGVIAHEMAHIKNRDTLINAVVATIAGAIAIIAEMVFWGALFSGKDEEGELLSAMAFMVLTPLIATIIRTAISRKMEFRADSDAVSIHGKKEGLSSALRKISSANERKNSRHKSKVEEAGANLFIYNPFSSEKITRFFSTHPPLEDRLENIESTSLGTE